jgi:arylsulfatase A-like enzyme
MDPHAVYVHHPEYDYRKENSSGITGELIEVNLNRIKDSLGPGDIRYITDTYDEEISFTDANVGRLIDSLNKLGLGQNTVIILSSDHGEEFKERSGFGHATTLYNELIHVPLIVHIPSEGALNGKRVTQNVEVRNIAKTIIDSCGLRDSGFGGKNLIDIAEGRIPDEIIYSQHSNANGDTLYKKAAINGNWKMIENIGAGRSELYDLGRDPLEKTNLSNSGDVRTVEERNLLSSALAGFNPEKVAESKTAVINNEDLKRLKSLGYVQ